MLTQHFQVRSVLTSSRSAAITLVPVTWWRESDTETEEIEGELVPKQVQCDPGDLGAEPDPGDGKMTELRIEGRSPFEPDDYVTLTVASSR